MYSLCPIRKLFCSGSFRISAAVLFICFCGSTPRHFPSRSYTHVPLHWMIGKFTIPFFNLCSCIFNTYILYKSTCLSFISHITNNPWFISIIIYQVSWHFKRSRYKKRYSLTGLDQNMSSLTKFIVETGVWEYVNKT